MKVCKSPANTSCMYQRIARDEAPDPEIVQKAYGDLYDHLGGDGEGLAMLKHLMNCLTGGGAYAADAALIRRKVAEHAAFRSGQVQAQAYDFSKRFPGVARIRNV